MGVRGVAVVLEASSSSALQGLWRPALDTSLPLEGIPGPQVDLVEDGAPSAQSLLQETGWRSVGDRGQLLPGCPSPVAGGGLIWSVLEALHSCLGGEGSAGGPVFLGCGPRQAHKLESLAT